MMLWAARVLQSLGSAGGHSADTTHFPQNAVPHDAHAPQQRLAAHLFEHLLEGVLVMDSEYRVLDANPAFTQMTGQSRSQILGTVPTPLKMEKPGSGPEHHRAAVLSSLQSTGTWQGEYSALDGSGEPRVFKAGISSMKGADGTVLFYVLSCLDITQSRQQVEQLARQAYFDGLTGLPNRVQLADMMNEALAASEREGFLLTVCYLDLDHFKPVNDRFTHGVGDRLLVELAERLRKSMRHWASGSDAVARLGGDEFVLLLRTTTLDEARYAVERILRNVSEPYALGVGVAPLILTSTIGATVYPLDSADADTLLRHADHAMYGAKQSGRNGYLFFDVEHDRRTEANFEAIGRVQEALEARQFVLYYQPKVDMRAGKVLGMEALLRWKHPRHGVIPPAQFLPVIEHTSLSGRVGDWVLTEGIAQLSRWLAAGLDITVSINVSAQHLQEPQFQERLATLLMPYPTDVAQRLVLEVLETAALANVDFTCDLMDRCRALGVRFALDDFGTGYSTLTYLKGLPLDLLKIDRSFVQNMLVDEQDMAIVEGVIGLSKTFGYTVVAEGVESTQHAQRLIDAGCDIGQGNGIAKAMPAEDVFHWVSRHRGPLTGEQAPEPDLSALGIDTR